MIELNDITVTLPPRHPDGATILENIDLHIDPGDWIALTGPNGSGKTTLLKTIAGLHAPTGGRVHTAHERTALLFQEPDNQFVATSVRDELLLSLPPGRDGSARVDEAVEAFSLATLLHRNPHRLSGGEKQRLAFATAWLSEPELLLLDEPTAYLDDAQSAQLGEFVAAMNSRGVAIVWTAPRDGDVAGATRVVRLDGGRIAYDGPPEPPRAASTVDVDDERKGAPAHGAAVVSMEAVSFGYDEGPVISDLSLVIGEMECVGLAGANGSGKSTVLGLASGLLKPTGGAVTRRYQRAVEGKEQNVFYLFQSPERLFFAETVLEEITFGLRSLGLASAEANERARQALREARLAPEQFDQRMPFSLSAGERRRGAFAMAWALRPRLLLLDEPTACLDDEGLTVFHGLVEGARTGGTTLVIAAHDRAMLSSVADRVVGLPSR